jgi:uncharacterized protein YndB with AHSA1/START domain
MTTRADASSHPSSAPISDSIRVTTLVSAHPEATFQIFTQEVDSWWKQGPRFRGAGGSLQFEPGEGGRLVQTEPGGAEFEIGRIRVWKPGEALVFAWRNRSFEAGQTTEVEVRFEAAGSGTRVSIEHRGWDSIPADHPAKHGLEGPALGSLLGLWWGNQLLPLRELAVRREARG